MERLLIINKIKDTIAKNLGTKPEKINPEAHMEEFLEWDSMKHVIIIDSIEKELNIKFDIDDMIEFETIEDIINSAENKLNSK